MTAEPVSVNGQLEISHNHLKSNQQWLQPRQWLPWTYYINVTHDNASQIYFFYNVYIVAKL